MRGPGRTELAALRLLAGGAAIAAVVALGGLLAINRLRGLAYDPALWPDSAISLGVILIAGCAAALATPRILRLLLGAGALLHLVEPALALAAAIRTPDSAQLSQWIPTASAAAALAAVLAWRLWWAWATLVTGAALTLATQARLGTLGPDAWANDLQNLMVGVVVSFVGTVVLATLAFASSTTPPPRDRLAQQADRALRQIDGLATDHPEAGDALIDELASEIRRVAPEAAISCEFAESGERGTARTIPPQIASAARSAMVHALENAMRHAGSDPRVRVSIAARAGELRITVTDVGRGFDPQRVPADRLGVRTSIVQQMRAVGGDAVVASAPGRGTSVELTWSAAVSPSLDQPRTELLRTLAFAGVALSFVLTQLALAVLAATTSTPWWPPKRSAAAM